MSVSQIKPPKKVVSDSTDKQDWNWNGLIFLLRCVTAPRPGRHLSYHRKPSHSFDFFLFGSFFKTKNNLHECWLQTFGRISNIFPNIHRAQPPKVTLDYRCGDSLASRHMAFCTTNAEKMPKECSLIDRKKRETNNCIAGCSGYNARHKTRVLMAAELRWFHASGAAHPQWRDNKTTAEPSVTGAPAGRYNLGLRDKNNPLKERRMW